MNSGKSERLNDPLGFLLLAPLAQLAEHRTLNPQVPGSSPGGRTHGIVTENFKWPLLKVEITGQIPFR